MWLLAYCPILTSQMLNLGFANAYIAIARPNKTKSTEQIIIKRFILVFSFPLFANHCSFKEEEPAQDGILCRLYHPRLRREERVEREMDRHKTASCAGYTILVY